MDIIAKRYQSPCGELLLAEYGGRLCLCDWLTNPRFELHVVRLRNALGAEAEMGETDVLSEAARQLDEYFRGERREFGVPLLLVGTEFQKRVWQSLAAIPFGSTTTYALEAAALGKPTAVRAVASANADNPLSIFLPCHRVVRTSGELGGYAGGLEAKRRLLELEKSSLSE